jgi:hypothetical protein
LGGRVNDVGHALFRERGNLTYLEDIYTGIKGGRKQHAPFHEISDDFFSGGSATGTKKLNGTLRYLK